MGTILRKWTDNKKLNLTINFFHCINEVMWILEAYKSEAFGLVSVLVSDHLGLHEGREVTECPGQHLISDIITQITTEYPKIICNRNIDIILFQNCCTIRFVINISRNTHAF